QVYVQLVRPVAGCQVSPPSTDTSTPATTPPASVAVPVTVTVEPLWKLAPPDGNVIVDVGEVVSVEGVASRRPDCSDPGCSCMSARRLTVACWTVTSVPST